MEELTFVIEKEQARERIDKALASFEYRLVTYTNSRFYKRWTCISEQ